jgi:hypothetical protein
MIRRACHLAYKGWELKPSSLLTLFEENTLFGNQPREIRFSEEEGRIFKTRQDLDYTIDVIPGSVCDQFANNSFNADYLVGVPDWWYYRSKSENLGWFKLVEDSQKKHHWILCLIPYDDEIGFDDTVVSANMSIGGVFVK